MNTVFVSSTNLGMLCCRKLIEMGESITGIISAPDNFEIKSLNHKFKNVQHSDFSKIAKDKGIPYYEIGENNMKDKGLINFLNGTEMDLMLVIGWHQIVPKKVREMFPLKVVGIHGSLLPKYRGGAPLVWSLINGNEKTGISMFYLEKGIDTGDILSQSEIPINKQDDIKTLYEKVNLESVKMVEEVIPRIRLGILELSVQDESQATYYPLRKPTDGIIDWNKDSKQIYNWVKAQTKPYPGAFTFLQDKQVKIWGVKDGEDYLPRRYIYPNGKIISGDLNPKVICSKGYIELLDYEINGENKPEIKGRFESLNEK